MVWPGSSQTSGWSSYRSRGGGGLPSCSCLFPEGSPLLAWPNLDPPSGLSLKLIFLETYLLPLGKVRAPMVPCLLYNIMLGPL